MDPTDVLRLLRENKGSSILFYIISASEELTFVAVQAARRQPHCLPKVNDCFLYSAHITQGGTLQKQSLHAVTVQLNGFGPQVQCTRVALTVKTVAAAGQNTKRA